MHHFVFQIWRQVTLGFFVHHFIRAFKILLGLTITIFRPLGVKLKNVKISLYSHLPSKGIALKKYVALVKLTIEFFKGRNFLSF